MPGNWQNKIEKIANDNLDKRYVKNNVKYIPAG